ncbi:MAG: VOC family protein [Anaerolineales bacterium]
MITSVETVGFTVSNLDEAKKFYTQVLPFTLVDEHEVMGDAYDRLTGLFGTRMRVARLKLGEEELQLTQYLTPPGGNPIPHDSRSNDLWFQHIAIVVSDMEDAYAQLREHNVQHVSTAPQTLPDYIEAAAGIKAFYFRDPDGHNLELIWFPEGKGAPRWQTASNVFLGIDHTAIAVGDTQVSGFIYDICLGMEVGGVSTNYGTEQEHLNGVFGCRVHITGWNAAGGIGIEFLDYLTPIDGRRMPANTRPNDLWHWETSLLSDNIELDYKTLTRQRMISAQIVDLPNRDVYGYARAFMFRDIDGHALKIVEK